MTPEKAVIFGGLLASLAVIVGYFIFQRAMHDAETPKMIVSDRQKDELDKSREEARKRSNFMVNLYTLAIAAMIPFMLAKTILKGGGSNEIIPKLIFSLALVAIARIFVRIHYPKDPHDHYL